MGNKMETQNGMNAPFLQIIFLDSSESLFYIHAYRVPNKQKSDSSKVSP